MEKYHLSSMKQDFVFWCPKRGCIRCISLHVYNNKVYNTVSYKNVCFSFGAYSIALFSQKICFIASIKL